MMDDMFDHLAGLRDSPVWQPRPDNDSLRQPLPVEGAAIDAVYDTFKREVLPYSVGNLHPGFMGWVHGGGTAVGMLAEMLAGALNANLGGRDHAPIAVERQVIAWAAAMAGFPADASGVLVTGTSMANFIGVLVARRAALGAEIRTRGIGNAKLVAYASAAAHGCIAQAMDMAGLGADALRRVPVDEAGRMDTGRWPVRWRRTGQLACSRFWLSGPPVRWTPARSMIWPPWPRSASARVCGFMLTARSAPSAALAPSLRPLLRGMEDADSLAFDFHKWGQVPYDAGCILVRDKQRQLDTFAQDNAYLRREARGLAGGYPWPCDLGPDLSRGFRALKIWMTLATFGTAQLGGVVERCCTLARRLAASVEAQPGLELLAPVTLNIVCFRVRALDDAGNASLVADIQEAGFLRPRPRLWQAGSRSGVRLSITARPSGTSMVSLIRLAV